MNIARDGSLWKAQADSTQAVIRNIVEDLSALDRYRTDKGVGPALLERLKKQATILCEKIDRWEV